LLERYGGCRWYAKHHAAIPKRETWRVPTLNETQRPAFVMREPFWWGMFDGDFAARCKANGNRMALTEKHGGKIRFGAGLFVHTFDNLVPPSEFFATHPEYFSELKGVRTADHSQLCLTNPNVVKLLTERLLARIRKDPDAKLYSVSQNDWAGYCTCPKCSELDEREGSPSGTMIHFVNQVAEAVEKEFPHAWIETLAYHYTRHPPKTLRPRHNVVPRLCSIECDFARPLDASPYPQNVKFVEDIKGWAAMTDKLYIWDYTTNFGHYIGPHPNFACLQGNVKFFRDHHVVGLFEQGAYQAPHAEFAELRAWALAKLLWNPDQDVEALYADFFSGYYGPAAKPVRTYFDELHALVTPTEHVLRIWSPMTSAWYTDEFFSRAARLWAEAEQLVENQPAYRYNVRMSAIPVLYARVVRWPKMDVRHVWRDGALRPEGVDPEYAALARELLARIEEGKITHVSESSERHQAFLALLQGRSEGFTPRVVAGAGLKAGVVPQMGGRVASLARGDGPSFLHADAGGVDCAPNAASMTSREEEPYFVAKAEPASLALVRDVHHRYRIRRTVAATEQGLRVESAVTSSRVQPDTVRPVLRVALDLGDAAGVAARVGDGEWQKLTVPEDQVFTAASLRGRELAGQDVLIASAATGRGVRVRLPNTPIERALLFCDTRLGAVRLAVLASAQPLPGRGTLAFPLILTPLDPVSGVPAIPVAKQHEPKRVVIEECLINLGRPGAWGELVADPDAEDGFAAKLFNTHYEWCLQWPIEPRWFQPGAKYKARVRLRVAKSDREGEAFWAGVYDSAKKTGHGQIQPKTSEVRDGYQWYDVAAWTPEDKQYVWVGPGRFDKQGGKPSAIEAVYVDRLEFTRAD